MFYMLRYMAVIIILLCTNIICSGCRNNEPAYISGVPEEGIETTVEDAVSTDEDTETTVEDAVSTDEGTDCIGKEEDFPVYVCGAVVNPGVFYFHCGDIKQSALEAAGGFLESAAEGYVNLAQELVKGERVYFPYEDEIEADTLTDVDMGQTGADGIREAASENSGRLDINTATQAELMTLPGIGESKASRIISYREENGPFASIEDIMKIDGIKEGVYSRIKDRIAVY